MANKTQKGALKKLLTVLLTLTLIVNMSALVISARDYGKDRPESNVSDSENINYEYIEINVNGKLAHTVKGPKGDVAWLVAGVYKTPTLTMNGNVLSYVVGNQRGTYTVTLPEGYTVAESTLESSYGGGTNSQSAMYDYAIINISITKVETPDGDIIEIDPEDDLDEITTEETTEEETTEEVRVNNSIPVKFFILNPNRTVPLDGADQGINSYYPSGNYDYRKGCYVYEANITGALADYMLTALANSDGDGKLDIGDKLLVNGNSGIIMPTDWKGLWDEFDIDPATASITAYVIKVQNPNDFSGSNGNYYGIDDRGQKADIHVDCYVSNLGVEVTYHANFAGANDTYSVDQITGSTHEVLDYDETDLPENDGYEFKGWATSQRGSVSYLSNGSFRVVGNTDLYAVWEKVVEVTTEEVTTEEETTEEEITEEETTEEETTEEETTEEETTEEVTTEEETTEEEITEEETTEEETTEEETTEEETTEEETTEEETTEEETTEEETTEEETTEEETTEEETTEEETTEEETTLYWPPVDPTLVIPVIPTEDPVESDGTEELDEIEDDDVPLDSAPETEGIEVTSDEEELDEIEDEDVPLSDVPQTGSVSAFYLIMTVASAIGLIGVNASKHDKKSR